MSEAQNIHIVSFNVPWPANYGGVIDVFYRIKSLAAAGVKVHLHCFTYGREKAIELERYCETVDYYPRETQPRHLIAKMPYIVASRQSNTLLERLLQDNYPILLEGLHCCWLLEVMRAKKMTQRIIIVRAHNIEHEYYNRLADVERNPLKRLYLRTDALKLKKYEPILQQASAILAVTQTDVEYFTSIGCRNVELLPSSHQHDDVVSQSGKGNYAVYHADLSVPENIHAALFLIKQVFMASNYKLVIAGRNPSHQLQKEVKKHSNITLVKNPDNAEMEQLIKQAQVNILVTKQPTGLKLKLLHALYSGRHCLVNNNMVAGTPLGNLCTIADTPEQIIMALDTLMDTAFTDTNIARRREFLGKLYSNGANAQKLIQIINGLSN